MKTFIKILIGFILGAISTFIGICSVFGYLEAAIEDERLEPSRERIADYTRNLGYDVTKKKETNKFKMGFH